MLDGRRRPVRAPRGAATGIAAGRRLALAGEQIAHAADHHLRLERLDEHAVAPDGARPRFVDRLERAGQQQHGMCASSGSPLMNAATS